MNPLTKNITTGTFGELLVQLRLLQYGVQAAPPLKDSGNDLIGIRGEVFRAIQVKTRTSQPASFTDLPDLYHILAIVLLDPEGEDTHISLDKCRVFLVSSEEVKKDDLHHLDQYEISQDRIDNLFS
jgi:hypothetical protein